MGDIRIHDETINGRDYTTRYSEFLEAVRQQTTKWWPEPTSFICFASDLDIDTICGRLKRPLSVDHDLFLIGMPEFKSARIWGHNPDNDIYELIPFLKKA